MSEQNKSSEERMTKVETNLDNLVQFIKEDLKPLVALVYRHELQIKTICWVGGIVLTFMLGASLARLF